MGKDQEHRTKKTYRANESEFKPLDGSDLDPSVFDKYRSKRNDIPPTEDPIELIIKLAEKIQKNKKGGENQ